MLSRAEPAQAVLDDDHGPIDDQAEVERAQAHQVTGHTVGDHSADRKQHRQRDDGGRDHSSADVSEQKEQNDDHEKSAFQQVLLDSLNSTIDKLGSIVDRFCNDTRRQGACCDLQFFGGGLRDRAAVFAHQHEDCAEYDFLAVLGGGARPQFLAHQHFGDVSDAYGYAVAVRDDDAFQIVDPAGLPRRAQQELFAIALDIACAEIGVVRLQRRDHISQRQAQSGEAIRPRRDVILPHKAADRVDLGDAFGSAQLRPDHPVLQRAQVFGCVG